MPQILGNSINAWESSEFPKSLSRKFFEYLVNFPNSWAFEKFPFIVKIKHPQILLGIWGISVITCESGEFPRYLGIMGNSPNTWESWGIHQIPRGLGNFPKYPVIREISKILKIYHSQITIGIWEIFGISQMP